MKMNLLDITLYTFYSRSTSFRLEHIGPSARHVFIYWTLVESEDRRKKHGSNLARLETSSELKKTFDSISL